MRTIALYYFLFLVAFIAAAVLSYFFLWDLLEDGQKMDVLYMFAVATITVIILLKITSLLAWTGHDEIRGMELRTVQEIRKDVNALFARLDNLQHQESIRLPVIEQPNF